MHFSGFDPKDFDVFTIGDFAGRMGAIRTQVRPHLAALGADLAEKIEEAAGIPTFPHVAQHMRRRVNPPAETWVAFGRDKKGYKRWTHYRVAVSEAGLRVTVFVEDDADDKTPFGAALQRSGDRILKLMGDQAPVLWYTLGGEAAAPHGQVTAGALQELGARLQRLKTLKFQAGVPLPRTRVAGMKPAELEAWIMEQVEVLKPLYLAGAQPAYRP